MSTLNARENGSRDAIFKEYLIRKGVHPEKSSDLTKLDNNDIVIVCDDSRSMANVLSGGKLENRRSRWDELRETVKEVLELALLLDKDGIEIYFLNEEGHTHVNSAIQVDQLFAKEPSGATPIKKRLTHVFHDKEVAQSNSEVTRLSKMTLIILATDGEPTDDDGNPKCQEFVNFVKVMPPNTYLSIVACTDDHRSVSYLTAMMDHNFPRVEVTDDFLTECEVYKKKNRELSHGDHILKIVLGSIDYDYSRKAVNHVIDNKSCCRVM